MANSSRVGQNTNRTIIIPQGTLNSDEVNVVYIPPSLNTTQPLIVKPALGKNKPLRAHSLPIWDDDLSKRDGESSNISHLIATTGCSFEDKNPNETYPVPAQVINNTQNLDEAFTSDNSDENEDYNAMCCDILDEGPNIVHLSSRSLKMSSDGPPQGHSITVDAPQGIESSLLGSIVQNNTRSGRGGDDQRGSPAGSGNSSPYNYFSPPFSSSQKTGVPDSYYDDMYDSSYIENSSGDLDDSMMARVMGGEFNVITPMTPSPTKPACPPTCSPPNSLQRGKNVTYPLPQSARPSPRLNISAPAAFASAAQQRASSPSPLPPEAFVCPASATFARTAQGSPGATFTAPMNATSSSPAGRTYTAPPEAFVCPASANFARTAQGPPGATFTAPNNATFAQAPLFGGNATYDRPAYPVSTTFTAPPLNATYAQGPQESINYGSFSPPYASTQQSGDVSDSYYDDMCDSSCIEESSGEIDDSMMGRVLGGEFNVITPMTPSPERPMPPPPRSPYLRGTNAIPQPNARSKMTNRSLPEGCPCPEDHVRAGNAYDPSACPCPEDYADNAIYDQPAYPANTTFNAPPVNATYAQGPQENMNYGSFSPPYASTRESGDLNDSYYDDMCDSSCMEESSGEIDDSMMGRVMGGEFNVITPMTPSPERPTEDCVCPEDYASAGNATYNQPAYPASTTFTAPPINATYTQGPEESINYGSFNPPYASSVQSGDVSDSYYDDMCDSSCLEESSGEIDDSMMGRVLGGEFNVITPMTPSPERPMPQPNQMTSSSLSEICPCPVDYSGPGNATYTQPTPPINATYTQGRVNATYTQGAANATYAKGAANATYTQGAANATYAKGAANATYTQGAANATCAQAAANATYAKEANATYTQGAANATYAKEAANATYTQGVPNATYTQGAANATYIQGAANATYAKGAANATYAQGVPNATYTQGAANATYAQGAANATYEEDCYCPDDLPDSYYDDMYDSSELLENSSDAMDDSMMARVMGGEFNVITPMTPSPTRPTAQLPASLANATFPQPSARGNISMSKSLPIDINYPRQAGATLATGPANATYAGPGVTCGSNATYAQSPNITGGSSYGDFNPPYVSSYGSEEGGSYYDDMYDSSNYSSGEMDDSMMGRVMGGEFNVITPMTPSPEQCPCPDPNITQGLPTSQANATYAPPPRPSPVQQRSQQANMTYPQPQAQRSLRSKNTTWPTSANPRSQSGSFRSESPNVSNDCSNVCSGNVGNTTY